MSLFSPGPSMARLLAPNTIAPVESEMRLQVSPLRSTVSPSTAASIVSRRLPGPESSQFVTSVAGRVGAGGTITWGKREASSRRFAVPAVASLANENEAAQTAASPIASGRILSARTRPARPIVFIFLSGGGGSLRSARTEERPKDAF
jgi:hypothetical protein